MFGNVRSFSYRQVYVSAVTRCLLLSDAVTRMLPEKPGMFLLLEGNRQNIFCRPTQKCWAVSNQCLCEGHRSQHFHCWNYQQPR